MEGAAEVTASLLILLLLRPLDGVASSLRDRGTELHNLLEIIIAVQKKNKEEEDDNAPLQERGGWLAFAFFCCWRERWGLAVSHFFTWFGRPGGVGSEGGGAACEVVPVPLVMSELQCRPFAFRASKVGTDNVEEKCSAPIGTPTG